MGIAVGIVGEKVVVAAVLVGAVGVGTVVVAFAVALVAVVGIVVGFLVVFADAVVESDEKGVAGVVDLG
jgi:hypothetical protein